MIYCIVETCDKAPVANGFCMFHYKRARFGRDLNAPFRPKILLPKTHPVYVAWTNMKTRCDNPKSTQFKWYGARGIVYCPEWKLFKNFMEDMLPAWKEGLILDRINNNEGYNPINCQWTTTHNSALNRRPKGST